MSDAIKRHPIILSFVAMLLLATAVLWTATSVSQTPSALADDPTPDPVPVRDILYRAGIDPVSLCALGIDADDTNAVVLACGAKADTIDQQLANKDADLATARADFLSLRRTAQAGTATVAQLTDLATRQTEVEGLVSDIATLLASVTDMGDPILTAVEESTLNALCQHCDSLLPTEFRTVDRSKETNADLQDALSQESFAVAQSETLDQAMQTLLTNERGATAVSLASTSLTNDLATVETAWETACATYE